MIEIMKYKGKVVRVGEYSREKFDSLQLDARRIMGLEPVKHLAPGEPHGTWPIETRELPIGHPQREGRRGRKYGDYLEPPEERSDTWEYAQRILKLKWPAACLWSENGLQVVSFSDLDPI